MGGAPALGGAGAGAAEVEALLREFPALGRTEDGRVKCSLTGHVMHAKPEVVRPYVQGKRFTQASAKARAMHALKQFEPHIVRSEFLPDKLFCRITGRYLAANERAVALGEQHVLAARDGVPPLVHHRALAVHQPRVAAHHRREERQPVVRQRASCPSSFCSSSCSSSCRAVPKLLKESNFRSAHSLGS